MKNRRKNAIDRVYNILVGIYTTFYIPFTVLLAKHYYIRWSSCNILFTKSLLHFVLVPWFALTRSFSFGIIFCSYCCLYIRWICLLLFVQERFLSFSIVQARVLCLLWCYSSKSMSYIGNTKTLILERNQVEWTVRLNMYKKKYFSFINVLFFAILSNFLFTFLLPSRSVYIWLLFIFFFCFRFISLCNHGPHYLYYSCFLFSLR